MKFRRALALSLIIALLLIWILVWKDPPQSGNYSPSTAFIDATRNFHKPSTLPRAFVPGILKSSPKLHNYYINTTVSLQEVNVYIKEFHQEQRVPKNDRQKIVLCVVCCGRERINETQTALKSAILFSSSPLQLIVFTELQYFNAFINMRTAWPAETQARVTLSLQEVHYPEFVKENDWRNLFRECASLRLFLPTLLPEVESVLYIDTDVLFVSPVEAVWHNFLMMNKTQLAAVTPEHQDSSAGWYNRFAKHPYYGKLGINSGVMLMQLARMRTFGWEDHIVPLRQQYKQHIRWGDQDLINILFHFHPELVYVLDCSYNFRPDHCMYGSVCKPASKTGAKLIHASRRAAFTDKFPPFQEVYNTIAMFRLGEDTLVDGLYERTKSRLRALPAGRCSQDTSVYTRQMQLYSALN